MGCVNTGEVRREGSSKEGRQIIEKESHSSTLSFSQSAVSGSVTFLIKGFSH